MRALELPKINMSLMSYAVLVRLHTLTDRSVALQGADKLGCLCVLSCKTRVPQGQRVAHIMCECGRAH